jgi:hypothetical protein
LILTLEEIRQSLLDAVVSNGFHIFWGAPHSFQGPTLHWNRTRKPEIESFGVLAKAEGVATLFVDWDVLSQKDLDWVQSLSQREYENDTPVDLALLVPNMGKIGRITVGYFKEGVCHIYEHTTPWFDELLKLEEITRREGPE